MLFCPNSSLKMLAIAAIGILPKVKAKSTAILVVCTISLISASLDQASIQRRKKMLNKQMIQEIIDMKMRGYSVGEIHEHYAGKPGKPPSLPTTRKYYAMDLNPMTRNLAKPCIRTPWTLIGMWYDTCQGFIRRRGIFPNEGSTVVVYNPWTYEP